MSVDSGLSGPVEGPVVPAAPRASTSPRVAPTRPARPGAARADALADAVSTPSFRTGRGRPRRRGRRVTRIVRRIELWSVLKIALVFNTILLGVVLGSVALLWGLANTTGLVDDLEGFLRDAGFEDFRFKGDRMFEQVAFIGAVGALATTVFMVLATALLNLISEITGGIRFVVIEEIVDPPAAPVRPPTPLALPTVPPTAPPLAAPAPASSPSPDAGGWDTAGRSDEPAPPSTTSTAKTSTAKTRTAKPTVAKKAPARRTATARATPKATPRGTTPSSRPSEGTGGETATGSGRRVRRQGAAPLRPAGGADDATEDDTSS
ncbi:MAG TPA: DUF3566 domain-containing protein [Iamia sp.]|nr:DUF3566 domain-containing protein [Iamia sp.]